LNPGPTRSGLGIAKTGTVELKIDAAIFRKQTPFAVEAAGTDVTEDEVVVEAVLEAFAAQICLMQINLPMRCSMAPGLRRKATRKEPISSRRCATRPTMFMPMVWRSFYNYAK
jgi:hypothetical protein